MSPCQHIGVQFVLSIVVILLSQTVGASFTKVPQSESVYAGQVAVFECQYPSAQYIRWRINGHPLVFPYPLGIATPRSGILHILGRQVYNGAQITCVAFTPIPFETSNVTLTVYDGFVKLPVSMNLTLNQGAAFSCQLKNDGDIIWVINRIVHTRKLPLGATISDDGNTSVLTFPSCINNTAIECRAVYHFEGQRLSERSPSVSMNCQGLLGAIHNFAASGIDNITWKAPFTLDLTNFSIDILYCFDMYNITCGEKALKFSDCNISKTQYTIPPVDYLFEMTISARSNVPNSRNGTPYSKQAVVVGGNLTGLAFNMLTPGEVTLELTLNLSEKKSPFEIYPEFYSLSATPMDGVDYTRLNCSTTANFTTGTMISLTGDCPLPVDRVYSIEVWAFGCYQHLVSTDSIELSTHRVRLSSIQPLRVGGVKVTGRYMNDTEITGFLAVFYSTTDTNSVHYYVVSRLPNQLDFELVLADHLMGQFAVSIFPIGKDNLPLPRAIGTPKLVKVKASQDPGIMKRGLIEYFISQNSTGVSVTCKFINTDPLTGCLVLVHPQISHLNSGRPLSITVSNFLNRSSDTAYGFFPGVDLDQHQVGVVDGKMIVIPRALEPSSDEKTTTGYLHLIGALVGAVMGGVTIVALIAPMVIIIIIWFVLRVCRRTNHKFAALLSKARIYLSLRLHDTTKIAESVPLTVEWLSSRLLPHASKWFEVGKALSVDEGQLNEIYANNERDEDSLREMLKLYLAIPDHNHSWEEIEAALNGISTSSTTGVQATTQDFPEQPAVILHSSEATFHQPTTLKHVIGDSEERKVHDQCQDDVKAYESHPIEACMEGRGTKSEAMVVQRSEPLHRPRRDRATRRDVSKLPLEISPPAHINANANANAMPFSGRAGELTPQRANSPMETVEDNSLMASTPIAATDGNVEKQDVATTPIISPTQETNAAN